jgi:hypothetical protein
MSLVLGGIAPRCRPPTVAKNSLDAALLDAVLAQIALPKASAGAGWRHPRRRRIVEAIAAYNPTNGAQATLVAQIVSARLLAEDTVRRATVPGLAEAQVAAMRRAIGTLMRTADQAEHTLLRAKRRARSPGNATASAGSGIHGADRGATRLSRAS